VAIWRVEELLRKVTEALNRARVPYAVVGGNAVAAWVASVDPDATRATKDVDLLTRRDCIDSMAKVLETIGFEQVEVQGITMFVEKVNPSPKRGVHILFTGEKLRPHYAHATPTLDETQNDIAAYPVVSLQALVEMKLQAFRLLDQTHVVDMKSVGLITGDLVAKLPPDLRERLDQIPEPDTH
jgi:hypothetical protein